MKYLGWFSCGVTSAVACKIAIDKYGKDVDLWYIDTGASHSDNIRFIKDCEKWYNKKISIARSNTFSSPLDVASKKIFNTPYGAPCTLELKKKVRTEIEKKYQNFCHVFGFEYLAKEINRANRWTEQQKQIACFPLIEEKLNKEDCKLILLNNGIILPKMYELGYNNNNCIGCFKGGIKYWLKIKKDFPDIFQKTAELERLKHSTCLKRNGKRLYLDEL